MRWRNSSLLAAGVSDEMLLEDLQAACEIAEAEHVVDEIHDVMDQLVGWCAPGQRLIPSKRP